MPADNQPYVTCGRPTRTGRPCARKLQWYENACLYHATSEEHWAAYRALKASGR